MAVSYNKLWKLMIDKNINKTKLRTEIGISSNAMANLGKNKSVQVEVLVKICNHLNCTLDDILEILPNENEDKIEGNRSNGKGMDCSAYAFRFVLHCGGSVYANHIQSAVCGYD